MELLIGMGMVMIPSVSSSIITIGFSYWRKWKERGAIERSKKFVRSISTEMWMDKSLESLSDVVHIMFYPTYIIKSSHDKKESWFTIERNVVSVHTEGLYPYLPDIEASVSDFPNLVEAMRIKSL